MREKERVLRVERKNEIEAEEEAEHIVIYS